MYHDEVPEDPMLKYSHPTLALILDYWPITIFAPMILLMIAVLALITRWWDRRDQAARANVRSPAADTTGVESWQSGRHRNGSPRSSSPFARSTGTW